MIPEPSRPSSLSESLALTFTMSALGAALFGCGEKTTPVVEETAKPVASATTSATASAASVEPPPPPTFVLRDMFRDKLKGYAGVFQIGGNLIVGDGARVGKIVGETIEWIKPIPEGNPVQGQTVLLWAGGRTLDEIDIFYRYDNGRWPAPTYSPLTGKGGSLQFAPGGGWGDINGVGHVGETTVVQGGDMSVGQIIQTARGPRIERYTIPASSQGCPMDTSLPKPAVNAWAFGSTENGTLLSAGSLCVDGLAAVEVWGPSDTKSKIIKLDKKISAYAGQVVATGPESAWILPRGGDILAYDKGSITTLPALEDLDLAWVGTDKILYASSSHGVHKYVDKNWQLIGHLAWKAEFSTAMTHEGAIWVSSAGGVFRLVPGTSLEFTDECKTPFVMMYDVSVESEPNFTFPATRKALSTFKDLTALELVDFVEGRRRLGIRVPSRAIGEAAIAHVKANMKDENPKLICYEPKVKRVIPIKAGK